MNLTAADAPVLLTTVAGAGGAPAEAAGTAPWTVAAPAAAAGKRAVMTGSRRSAGASATEAWTVAAYFPYQTETGGPCSFSLRADALAPSRPLDGAVKLAIEPGQLPTVLAWDGLISRPETVQAASSGNCTLSLAVRGPADFMGDVASWDGVCALRGTKTGRGDAAATTWIVRGQNCRRGPRLENFAQVVRPDPTLEDLFDPFLGIAGGRWVLSVALAGEEPCDATFERRALDVLNVTGQTNVSLSATNAVYLAVPAASPPDAYSRRADLPKTDRGRRRRLLSGYLIPF